MNFSCVERVVTVHSWVLSVSKIPYKSLLCAVLDNFLCVALLKIVTVVLGVDSNSKSLVSKGYRELKWTCPSCSVILKVIVGRMCITVLAVIRVSYLRIHKLQNVLTLRSI